MRKRGWRVGVVREFFPENKNLLGLNVNRGQEIRIRLRPSYDEGIFLPYESLVGTMLHELTHIVHGPHDAKFYKLLDELQDEYETNAAKGFAAFDGPGRRVGEDVSHTLPAHLARKAAADAALKRLKINQVMPAGGRRLGGAADSKALEKLLSPAQLAAMAAERRVADRIWCGSAEAGEDVDEEGVVVVGGKRTGPGHASASGSGSKSHRAQSPNDHTPIVIDAGGVEEGSLGKSSSSRDTTRKRKLSEPASPSASTSSPSSSADSTSPDGTWTCPQCTLINKPLALQCDCCWAVRPHPTEIEPASAPPPAKVKTKRVAVDDRKPLRLSPPPTSVDLTDDGDDDDNETWMCPQCTLMNDTRFRMCSACQYLRAV
ncbi:hypothetical protein HK104_004990 [Borealophlyctis nickersoniae]|nr:hypothetical protein HK104_004990 [Borealophlyctis nickersoniae]